jgi:lipoprotein-releasing system permease protein
VYKLLLCWRYLLTRYLALACIVSVMLGVATLIVVNSVMSGFSTKLKERLHGLLSDVVIEANNTYIGFANFDQIMERIRQHSYLGPRIEAMTGTLEVFAMLQFRLPNGQMVMRPVRLIGVEPKSRSAVGGFKEYLEHQKGKREASFEVPAEARRRLFREDIWQQQVQWQQYEELRRKFEQEEAKGNKDAIPPVPPPPAEVPIPKGIIVGNAIASYRKKNTNAQDKDKDIYFLHPGDEVRIITYKGGQELAPANRSYLVCDFFKSEMSEYDSNYVFVPLEDLQELRELNKRVTSIQMRLKDYQDARKVIEVLQRMFPTSEFRMETWEDKQGPLLAAIAVEKGILNVLLFLIIGVAGFGILAIFAMIVAEKTRDIGILKALGASNGGVMKIFLGYGLLLGVVGAGLGTIVGLALTMNINGIEKLLAGITGQDLFPRDIYYFDQIPTYISILGVILVNVGAVAIAVLASVLPALRAALLHPVKALRYE